MLVWRHHCRYCGGVFCGECADKEFLLMPPRDSDGSAVSPSATPWCPWHIRAQLQESTQTESLLHSCIESKMPLLLTASMCGKSMAPCSEWCSSNDPACLSRLLLSVASWETICGRYTCPRCAPCSLRSEYGSTTMSVGLCVSVRLLILLHIWQPRLLGVMVRVGWLYFDPLARPCHRLVWLTAR